MPELPEVETLRRTLEPAVVGQRIVRVGVYERRLRRPIEPGFERRLRGRRIRGVGRRGKYLLIDVGDARPLLWVVHLGMSGRLLLGAPPEGARHVHVRVDLEQERLYYQDPRRFGLMRLVRDAAELGPLGVDPLADGLDGATIWRLRARHPRTTIRALLLDQRAIAGLGNIYVHEALHRAGIRPGRRVARLRRAEAERLAEALRDVLERAIASGGSSLLDYRDATGAPGRFQETLRVYGRAGRPCLACGTRIAGRRAGGRGVFYCPRCQV